MLLEPLYRKADDDYIPCRLLRAFVHNAGSYYLVEVEVFRDGMIHGWGMMTTEKFKAEVRRGWIVTGIPEDARVFIGSSVVMTASHVANIVEPEEFIKEVEDIIRELNGERTTLQQCREMLHAFQARPTEEARQRLRDAYERVPKHRRIFIGGQEKKDSEVRAALGLGDDL